MKKPLVAAALLTMLGFAGVRIGLTSPLNRRQTPSPDIV